MLYISWALACLFVVCTFACLIVVAFGFEVFSRLGGGSILLKWWSEVATTVCMGFLFCYNCKRFRVNFVNSFRLFEPNCYF